MGEQIWEDTRAINEYLSNQEKLWSNQLGRLLHETSRKNLSKLGEMLTMFEAVADRFNEREEHIEWVSPYTGFPVVQNYRKAVTARTKLRYGDQELYVHVENWDDSILNKDSQKLGASPNFVHSLDACHLHMVVDGADFPLALCHDSFGCTAGNMSRLFSLVREKFVELYEGEPLEYIMKQLNCEDLIPEKGSLDVRLVLESDYAFA